MHGLFGTGLFPAGLGLGVEALGRGCAGIRRLGGLLPGLGLPLRIGLGTEAGLALCVSGPCVTVLIVVGEHGLLTGTLSLLRVAGMMRETALPGMIHVLEYPLSYVNLAESLC